MNIVLYKRGTTNFNNNGLGILAEAFDVSVKDTVNDLFVCDLKYPITGKLFKELANGDIIRVDASPLLKSQRFTIQTITHNDKGYVSVHCLHKMIADMSTDYLKEPIQSKTPQSCAYAMNLAFNKSYKCKNYIAKTDIVNGQPFNISRRNLQNVLLGKEGSIIDTFGVGAEIEYDNSKGDVVSILRRRGHETNVLISYAKNISGYNCVMDVQELYTVIVPFAVNNDTKETIYGADVYAPNWEDFDGELFIKEQDFTDRFEQDEEITQEKLKKHAEDYLLETKCNEPKFTFKIDFIQLENKYLDEYNLDSLYEVNIGDTVYVYHRLYNVRTQARINSIVYDPATNKITKLIIGDVRPVFTTDSLKGKDGVDGKDGKDGINGVDGVPGPPGENGESLYTWIKYATSNSGTNMSDDPTGRDYIGVAYNKPTALESNNPTDYTWSLYKGKDGIDGIPGKDGTTFYTWIKYADDAEGNGMSDTPEGKSYMGIAYNKLTKEESTNAKDYAWSLIKGADGQNGSMETLPDVLPDVPVARAHVYGVGSVEISWSFDNRFYFDYEVYASSVKGFSPTVFDRIFRGKASSTTQQITPPKTMYYKVRAVNSHGKFTAFSNEVEVSVQRIEDMTNYFSEMAIGRAVVNSLTADYMEAGIIKGNWIDAKEISVTDGNGKRTFLIDSFGNVSLDVTELLINSNSVATKNDVDKTVNKYGINYLVNSNYIKRNSNEVWGWSLYPNDAGSVIYYYYDFPSGEGVGIRPKTKDSYIEYHSEKFKISQGTSVAISADVVVEENVKEAGIIFRQIASDGSTLNDTYYKIPDKFTGRNGFIADVTNPKTVEGRVIFVNKGSKVDDTLRATFFFNRAQLELGTATNSWKISPLDTVTASVTQIRQDMDEIDLSVRGKVGKNEVISSINLSQENVKINAQNIDISGVTTIGSSSTGRYIKIENEDYGVYNGNIKCLQFGYKNWQNREGLPEFLMGANGMAYDSTGRSGNYFGMTNYTREKNPNGWDLDYQCLYYKRAGNTREVKIEMAEDGRMRLISEHSFSVLDKGYGYLTINHGNGGLMMENGFTAGKYDRCTFLKDIVVEGAMCYNDLQQGVKVDKYYGKSEYNLRPKSGYAIDVGHESYRFRNAYLQAAPNISSDISLKENIEYTDYKTFIGNADDSIIDSQLTYKDMYEYFRDIYRSAEYNYSNDDKRVLGIIANDIVDTKVGSKIITRNADGKLSYLQETRVTVLEGALKYSIQENEKYKDKCNALEAKLDAIIKHLGITV